MKNEKQKQELLKIEKEVEAELKRTIDSISKDRTTDKLEKIYSVPKQMAKLVAKGNVRGFLLYGEAGLGKTYLIKRAFIEAKEDLVCLRGHITSLKLHEFLYTNRKKHILLDDINILESEKNLNLLKSALEHDDNIVEYETTSKLLNVPNKFVFEGTITLLLNSIPRSCESLVAVESRILYHELVLSYEQKMDILREIAEVKEYKELEKKQRLEIFEWIKKNTNEATENLSLRLLFICYEIYRYDNKTWKTLAIELVKVNEELELIVQGLGEFQWCQKTGRGRATYYRYKKNLPKKTCECGNKMNFDREICETCQDNLYKKETNERNIQYEKERVVREKKQKAKFIVWRKQSEGELKVQFEEQKAEFGDELDVEFDEFCEMAFENQNQ